jgi:hypothetical protein
MDVLGMGAPIVPVAPFIAAPFVFVVDVVGTGAPVFPVVVFVVFVVAVLGEWVDGLKYVPLDLFLFFCCRSMASVLFAQCAASHLSRSNTFSLSSQSSSSSSSLSARGHPSSQTAVPVLVVGKGAIVILVNIVIRWLLSPPLPPSLSSSSAWAS